ncbi:hypothetical protein ACWF94_09225 [Streptomyces sp. NPDC055078]
MATSATAWRLVDSGYVSVVLVDRAARDHGIDLVGPLRSGGIRQYQQDAGFSRNAFDIDFENRSVTCPRGEISRSRHGPYPTSSETAAPVIVVKFSKHQCEPCTARTQCTRSTTRVIGSPPKELFELQHRRGSGRPAAAGQRRREHGERPHHRPGHRARTNPRCPPPRQRHPHPHRHAGGARAFLTHLRNLRRQGIRTGVSVGHPVTEPVRRAIRALPRQVWHPALEQDGSIRGMAGVAEPTGMADPTGYPDRTRITARRERPHPRCPALCSTSMKACATRSSPPTLPTAGDPLLHGELADAEPKKLRYRLLHTAARLTRGGRRLHPRIAATRPWRHEPANAFACLAALPRPPT